jgi:hypothetical protein
MRTIKFYAMFLFCVSMIFVACSSDHDDNTALTIPTTERTDSGLATAGTGTTTGVAGAQSASPIDLPDASIGTENGAIADSAIAADSDASADASDKDSSSDDRRAVERGSCCEAHEGTGCNDPAIEACVCAADALPDCCDKKWDVFCVEIVKQRYCEKGIRQCVCMEWQQEGCCTVEWTESICETTAELKCGASGGCGQRY